MKRPERLKILGKRYAVNWGAELEDGLNGCNDSDTLEIKVRNGLKLETEQDVLLHEVMHGVEAQMGLDLEETVIERLATGLLAVLKDNPKFVRYLSAKK